MTEVAYIAGRFDRRNEFVHAVRQLEDLGITCTAKWITDEPDLANLPEGAQTSSLVEWALRDVEDVSAADTLITFTEDLMLYDNVPSVWARGGRHVELGMALALGKRIVVIGPRENIFTYLPQVEVLSSFDEFISGEKAVRGIS
jgi:hypothetical protein